MSKNCPGTQNVQNDENVKPEEANIKKSIVGVLDVTQSADADVTEVAGKTLGKSKKQGQKKAVVKF